MANKLQAKFNMESLESKHQVVINKVYVKVEKTIFNSVRDARDVIMGKFK